MKIIEQSHKIETTKDNISKITKNIEKIARTCYQSDDKIGKGTDIVLCEKLIDRGHEAMLEHAIITVRFITDRGVSHELVRHRIGTAFAQESTRYVRYDGNMEFIRPVFDWANGYGDKKQSTFIFDRWRDAMLDCEEAYQTMIKSGCSPQEARTVLPNSLKTSIVVSANIREWRHILDLRCAKSAHPQIRALMKPLLIELHEMIPVLFVDLYSKYISMF